VADIAQSVVFNAYIARAEKEYEARWPTPDQYKAFLDQISKMWETQPHFTAEQLHGITVLTWIVDADHDEAIRRENTEFMANPIPNAGLLVQPQVSHFSFLQDPGQFTRDVLHFMELRTSSRVTSRGVPSVAIVVNNRSELSPRRKWIGTTGVWPSSGGTTSDSEGTSCRASKRASNAAVSSVPSALASA
jgi:hypothetical protein